VILKIAVTGITDINYCKLHYVCHFDFW